MQFKELDIIPEIRKALEKENYEVPTPIQEKAIPVILEGRDLLGCAQTGTGKTAAFAIPTLQLLSEDNRSYTEKQNIKALIITPTRELALQIYESFCTYGRYTKLKCCVIYGGVSQKPQEEKLSQGVDILVATPGRLNDFINQKIVDLNNIKICILDEADRMLDMGFIHDVKHILSKTPVNKQTLLFSATMPPDIASLSAKLLQNPVKIEITPVSSTVDLIDQYLYYVDKSNKKDLLLHILKDKKIASALVFTRTKHGADRIVRQLSKEKVTAQAIHGDKSQGARQTALSNFKDKKLRILIATDIAARGIDIDELSHVINYDLPDVPETYVHRIGRTGRAGFGGVAISFCDFDEQEQLKDIEKLIGKELKVIRDHPYPLMNNFPAVKNTQPRRGSSRASTVQPDMSERTMMKADNSHKKESHHKFSQKISLVNEIPQQNNAQRGASQQKVSEKTNLQNTASYRKGSEKKGPQNTTSYLKDSEKKTAQNLASYPKDSRKNAAQNIAPYPKSSERKVTQKTPSNQMVSENKVKYYMAADGSLKEKRSFFKFPKRNNKESNSSRKRNKKD